MILDDRVWEFSSSLKNYFARITTHIRDIKREYYEYL